MTDDLIVAPDLNYAAIASQTEGYLPADLRDLVDRIVQQSTIRTMKSSREEPRANSEYHHMAVSMQDVNAAQNDYVPLTLRDVKLQKSETQWADIGGLQETRRVLRETLEWPTKYSAIFASSPLRLRSGYVLSVHLHVMYELTSILLGFFSTVTQDVARLCWRLQ